MVEQETKQNDTSIKTEEISEHETQVTEESNLITTEEPSKLVQEETAELFTGEEPVINEQTEDSSESTIQIELETTENNNQENELQEFLEKHAKNISTNTEAYIKILEETIQKLKDN